MPSQRKDRKTFQHSQNLKQSQRTANAAIRIALSETPPDLVAKLREEGFSARARLSRKAKTAFVTERHDFVTFGVTDFGRLKVNKLGAARHEVSHLVGSSHSDIGASPGGARFASSLGNSQGIRQSIGVQGMTGSQKMSRSISLRKREVRVKLRRGPIITRQTKAPKIGFTTPLGQKILSDPNSSKRALKQARGQAFKAGIRAKRRGVDF